ncbi:MAG: hypothetical protein MJA30_07630 [Cytophagales bacterium]|nr:hypothetical protein [Cytophagales bacterium]
MMKKVLLWGVLCVCVGCEDHLAVSNNGMEGQWEISWAMDEESASALLNLRKDQFGEIIADNPSSSWILPGSHYVDIEWEKTNDTLRLKRMDNNFVLDYRIIDEAETTLKLSFTEDIHVTLERLEE